MRICFIKGEYRVKIFFEAVNKRYIFAHGKLHLRLFYGRTDKHLDRIINGQTILILGSGPSAKSLHSPPKGTIVVSCNYAPLALPDLPVDIFLFGKYCLKGNANFEREVLNKIRCKTILSNLTKYLVLGKHYYEDSVVNTSMVNDFVGDISRIQSHAVALGEVSQPSTGLFLLLLCAKYHAKEIYLCGIEFDFENYVYWDNRSAAFSHSIVDTAILSYLRNSDLKIHSYSPSSGSTRFFPFKDIHADH